MLTTVNRSASLFALLLFTGLSFAQSQEVPKFYRLDFVLKEVEGGKVLNARAYSTSVSTEKSNQIPCSIRTGSRMQIPTIPGANQFTFTDVGTNIDCRTVQEVGAELSMVITAEVNSVLQDTPTTPPVTRKNSWGAVVIVPLKKPTVLFSSDDAMSKRQMQLELTATLIR